MLEKCLIPKDNMNCQFNHHSHIKVSDKNLKLPYETNDRVTRMITSIGRISRMYDVTLLIYINKDDNIHR